MDLNSVEPGPEATESGSAALLGLSLLARRALVSLVVDGPQPIDDLAQRLGASVATVGSAARALVVRGAAIRVPRKGALPVLVASTGGSAIVRDRLARAPDPQRAP